MFVCVYRSSFEFRVKTAQLCPALLGLGQLSLSYCNGICAAIRAQSLHQRGLQSIVCFLPKLLIQRFVVNDFSLGSFVFVAARMPQTVMLQLPSQSRALRLAHAAASAVHAVPAIATEAFVMAA